MMDVTESLLWNIAKYLLPINHENCSILTTDLIHGIDLSNFGSL